MPAMFSAKSKATMGKSRAASLVCIGLAFGITVRANVTPIVLTIFATSVAARGTRAEPTTSGMATAPSNANVDVDRILKLDADKIARFLLALKSIQSLPPATDDGTADTNSGVPVGESEKQSLPTPFKAMISNPSARAAIDPIAKSNGFQDADHWARAGDRLALLIGIVDAIEGSQVARSEIDATKAAYVEIRKAFAIDEAIHVEDGAQ